jgi:hypothetical protein
MRSGSNNYNGVPIIGSRGGPDKLLTLHNPSVSFRVKQFKKKEVKTKNRFICFLPMGIKFSLSSQGRNVDGKYLRRGHRGKYIYAWVK